MDNSLCNLSTHYQTLGAVKIYNLTKHVTKCCLIPRELNLVLQGYISNFLHGPWTQWKCLLQASQIKLLLAFKCCCTSTFLPSLQHRASSDFCFTYHHLSPALVFLLLSNSLPPHLISLHLPLSPPVTPSCL